MPHYISISHHSAILVVLVRVLSIHAVLPLTILEFIPQISLKEPPLRSHPDKLQQKCLKVIVVETEVEVFFWVHLEVLHQALNKQFH